MREAQLAPFAATAIAAALAATAIAGAGPAHAAAGTPVALGGSTTTAGLAAASTVGTAAATAPAQVARLTADPLVAAYPPPLASEMPMRTMSLSVGTGQLIHLGRPIAGIFVADDKIADVQVKSATQVYLFAKGAGQTSIYATDKSGAVVWSGNVRVGANLADVGGMLKLAMPEDQIVATPVSGMLMLTGLVLSPKDAEEAQRLSEAFLGQGVTVINHLRVATPQQVSLHVKIAEVSRSISRDIGVNLTSLDRTGGFQFGIGQGNAGTISPTQKVFNNVAGTTLGFAGKAFGLDLLSTLQLAENDGLVATLAEPTLVALSGETASFLAGGEIPIPQSQGLGTVSVEFKQYGVSLSFTPTVVSEGRIVLRVRPEVSQLSDSGSVKLNGFTIPALTTRRADTTVELGSGQSFVIGGLLQNNHNNSTSKAPFLGDLPILGALFKSNGFRKQETELMIVVTPYIVKPIDANRVALPTDGYTAASPTQRVFTNKALNGTSGATRPMPSLAPGATLPPPSPPAASAAAAARTPTPWRHP